MFDLNKLIPNLKKAKYVVMRSQFQSLQDMTKSIKSASTRFFREK